MPCLAPARWIFSCDGNHQRPSGGADIDLADRLRAIHSPDAPAWSTSHYRQHQWQSCSGRRATDQNTVLIGEQEKSGGLSMIINIAP